MTSRPSIPAEVSRALLIEAGHRCAVCGVPCPLERAHIIPWCQSHQHRLEDLVCLCANCHERADKEKWGEAVLREYKKDPWVSRQNETPHHVADLSRIEITIEKDYRNFDEHDSDILRHALASFLQVSAGSIKIRSTKEGSTVVLVELPSSAAEELVAAFQRSDPTLWQALPLYPVKDIVMKPKAMPREMPREGKIPRQVTKRLFEIAVGVIEGVVVMNLTGELTIKSGADYELREKVNEILESGEKKLLLNLQGVIKMDSSGLGELIRTKSQATSRDATVKLMHVEEDVQQVLEMTRLIGVFETFEDEIDAIASFRD